MGPRLEMLKPRQTLGALGEVGGINHINRAKKLFIKPGNGSLYAVVVQFLEEVQENERRQMGKSMSTYGKDFSGFYGRDANL